MVSVLDSGSSSLRSIPDTVVWYVLRLQAEQVRALCSSKGLTLKASSFQNSLNKRFIYLSLSTIIYLVPFFLVLIKINVKGLKNSGHK